jgi:hypothetical protein
MLDATMQKILFGKRCVQDCMPNCTWALHGWNNLCHLGLSSTGMNGCASFAHRLLMLLARQVRFTVARFQIELTKNNPWKKDNCSKYELFSNAHQWVKLPQYISLVEVSVIKTGREMSIWCNFHQLLGVKATERILEELLLNQPGPVGQLHSLETQLVSSWTVFPWWNTGARKPNETTSKPY